MKKSLLITLFSVLGLNAWLQDVPFDKALFKERKDEFKIAEDELKAGDALFLAYPADYQAAVGHYLKANAFNPNSGDLNYKIGVCYLNFDKYQMKPYFEKAYNLKPTVAPDIL